MSAEYVQCRSAYVCCLFRQSCRHMYLMLCQKKHLPPPACEAVKSVTPYVNCL